MELASAIIGILGVLAAILFGFLAFRRGQKKDDQGGAARLTAMETKLDYISSGVNRIEQNQHDLSVSISDLSQRVTRVEESAKQAHKRIDSIVKSA